jgi:ribonuclease Z
MNVNDVIRGHSKAMYSTWFLYRPDGLLFDCGEGVALTLNTQVFAVNTILLSHGHLDHIMGLPGFFFTRSAARGDKMKPLRIVHPAADKDIHRLKDYINGSFQGQHALKFPLKWVEVRPGDTIHICDRRWIRTFATRHDPERITVGYELLESRKKLREGLRGLPGKDIAAMVKRGEQVWDEVPRRVLVYTGDTMVQDLEVFENTELVMHEATFVNREDVKYDSHSLADDVLEVMAKRKPKELMLMHFSTRYSPAMCGASVRSKAKAMAVTFPIWIQFGEYAWKCYDPENPDDAQADLVIGDEKCGLVSACTPPPATPSAAGGQ